VLTRRGISAFGRSLVFVGRGLRVVQTKEAVMADYATLLRDHVTFTPSIAHAL
jgi:hypothetical protein